MRLRERRLLLRLWQLEGTALLNGILRGDDEERRREGERVGADRHLSLLHRLEQRALHLRRGPVDLVGEEEIGEHWPLHDAKLPRARIEDLRTGDVAGEEIDRELHALGIEIDRLCQHAHEQRLREPGNPFEKEVPASEEGD